MTQLRLLLTIFTLFLVISCLKQETPPMKSELNLTQSDVEQLRACRDFTPYNHQLSQTTTRKMFECNKWSKQFSELYKAILRADSDSWNYIFSPIDDRLFESEIGRKKFIGIFKGLENKGGLDDLGKMGEAFFKSPLVSIVADSKHKDDVKELLELLKLPSDKRQIFFNFFQALNKNLTKNEKLMKENLYPFLTDSYLSEFRLWIADYWAKRFINNEMADDFLFVSRILNPKEDEAWFYRWIKSDYVNQDNLKSIFEYPSIERPEVHNDGKYVKNILKTGFVCKNNGNETFFNIVPEIKNVINALTNKNQEVFFERQVDHKNKLLLFENICDQIVVDGKNDQNFLPTFKRLFLNIHEFLSNEMNYIFTQGFHRSANVTGNDFYYLDFLAGDFFSQINQMAKLINEHGKSGFYNLLYQALKSNSANDFSDYAAFFNLISKDEQLKKIIRAYARLWLKLSVEEKHNLSNTIDVFFSPEVKGHLILENYLNFFQEFPQIVSDFSDIYANNPQTLDKTYESLHHLAISMNDPKVLTELQKYFGETHMIKVVHAILNGYSSTPETVYSTVSSQMDDIFIPYVPTQNYRYIEAYKLCVADLLKLTNQNVQYYEMVGLYPKSCMDLDHGPITHDLFVWYKKVNQNYQEVYGPGLVIFDQEGFLSKDSLQQILVTIIELGKAYKIIHPDENISDLVHSVYEVIVKRGNTHVFETLFSMGGEYYRGLNAQTEASLNTILKKLISTPDENIKSFLSPLGGYLKSYKTFQVPNRILFSSNECKNLNPNLGVNPCVPKYELKQRLKRIIEITTRKFEGAPGLLEELIALLHPDGGTELPYLEKGKTKKHYISLEEIIRFFHHNQSNSDLRPMAYSTPEGTTVYQVDNVSSLEVVIRDISFLNNFYGAFFKNAVSEAKSYQNKVKRLEGQVNLMVNSGGLLRKVKIYPKETEWLLKNVKSSYYGLIHVGDQFKLGSEYYSYADMMQSILATVVKTSHPDVQKFTPFWIPNTKFGDKHNGEFLTQFVKLSGMRNLGNYLKSRLGNDPEKLFANKNFRRFNDELPRKIKLKTMQETLRYITDHYAKNESDVFYELIDDLIDWTDRLNPGEISKLEDLIINSGLLLTHTTDNKLDQLVWAFRDLLKLYRPFKAVWPNEIKLIDIVAKLNSFSEFVLSRIENNHSDKTWFNQFVSSLRFILIDSGPTQIDEIIELVSNKPLFWINSVNDLMINVEKFYKSLSEDELGNMNVLLTELMKSESLKFIGLKSWLLQSTIAGKHKNEILRLMDFLSKKIRYNDEDSTNFRVMLEEFLGKEGNDLGALLDMVEDVITVK